MRNLNINKQTLYVLNYQGIVKETDSDGNLTGDTTNSYSEPIKFKASVSGARGNSQSEVYGNNVRYDKTICMSKALFKQLGLSETSVFFVDIEPTFDNSGFPLYDYKVARITQTVNEVVIAISKVRAE